MSSSIKYLSCVSSIAKYLTSSEHTAKMQDHVKLPSKSLLRPGQSVKKVNESPEPSMPPRSSNFVKPARAPRSLLESELSQPVQRNSLELSRPTPAVQVRSASAGAPRAVKAPRLMDDHVVLPKRTVESIMLQSRQASSSPASETQKTLGFRSLKVRSKEAEPEPFEIPPPCDHAWMKPVTAPTKAPVTAPKPSSKGKERADGMQVVDGKVVKRQTTPVVAVPEPVSSGAKREVFTIEFWQKVFDLEEKLRTLGFRKTLHELMTTDEPTYWADHINFDAVPPEEPLDYTPNFPYMNPVTWTLLSECKKSCFMHSEGINLFMHMVYAEVTKDRDILNKSRFQDIYCLELPSEEDFRTSDADFETDGKKPKSPASLKKLEKDRGTFAFLPTYIGSTFLGHLVEADHYTMPEGIVPANNIFMPAFVGELYPRENRSTKTKQEGCHFILLQFCLPSGEVKVYESLRCPMRESARHCARIFGRHLNFHLIQPQATNWKEVVFEQVPKQKNNNCALHVMANLAHIILGTPNGPENCERLRRVFPAMLFAFKLENCDRSLIEM